MARWAVFVPPAVFLGLATLFYTGMQRENPDELPSLFVGRAAPAVTEEVLAELPGVAADKLSNGEYRLVNFWASWCPPCRAEHPRLLQMQAQGIPIVGVNMKDRAEDAVAFLSELKNPFAAVAFDPKGRTSIDWGVTAPPETFIINQSGIVVYRHIGPLVGTDYERRFLPALTEVLKN